MFRRGQRSPAVPSWLPGAPASVPWLQSAAAGAAGHPKQQPAQHACRARLLRHLPLCLPLLLAAGRLRLRRLQRCGCAAAADGRLWPLTGLAVVPAAGRQVGTACGRSTATAAARSSVQGQLVSAVYTVNTGCGTREPTSARWVWQPHCACTTDE